MPVRHQIATRIRQLKVRARDVGDRRKRYGVTVPPVTPEQCHTIVTGKGATQPGGPEEEEDLRRRELLLGEPPDTIEEGTKRILGCLLSASEDWHYISTCISIAGRGRVGKTAIARRLFQHPSVVSSFNFRAWVNFGGAARDFDEVYQEILEPPKSGTLTNEETGSMVREHLWGKKSLIVLDATPPASSWDERNQYELASLCDACTVVICTGPERLYWHSCRNYTFSMHQEQTRPWFYRRRAIALANCPLEPMDHVLTHCHPDTFALQMFLHLLYANPNRSEMELNSLSDLLQQNRNNIAKTMLMFCYNELPVNYKSCLLYLSIFPQDHIIRRTSLLRRWIAEGLIAERSTTGRGKDRSLEDQAQSIFDGLVARGFVSSGEASTSGKIKTCTVHRTVQEFITTDVSLIDICLPSHLAHRLSINNGIALQEASSSTDPTVVTKTLLEYMPQSPQWQLLKVLDFEGCTGFKKKHLKNICKILLLKYLSLRNTDATELPKHIEKLQCLETLDIRETAMRAFSTKSVKLPMLKYFLAGRKIIPHNRSDMFDELFATVHLPSGIRRMKKLEVMSHVEVSRNVHDLTDIGQLLQLRKLGVVLHGTKGVLDLLFQQIEKLHDCLRSLSIRINQQTRNDSSPDAAEVVPALVNPPKLLESLSIYGIKSGLPNWVAQLEQLMKVTLRETFLGEDALHVLGKLRILRCLRLLHKSYTGRKLNFRAEEFQQLRSLVVKGEDITNISFDTGATTKLEMIIWSYGTMEALSLSGVDHLPRLKKLKVNGDCKCNLDPVKAAIEEHPNRPELKHNPHPQCQEDGTAMASSSSSAP